MDGNALNACQDYGIRTQIKCSSSQHYRLSNAVMELQEYNPWFTEFVEMPVIPVGRAKADICSNDLIYSKSLPIRPCRSPEMIISPSSKVYGCCNGGGINFLIGDIQELSLSQLLYKYNTDLVLCFIKNNPVSECLKFLPEEKKNQYLEKKYVDECHLCYEIFADFQVKKCITKSIENLFISNFKNSKCAKLFAC